MHTRYIRQVLGCLTAALLLFATRPAPDASATTSCNTTTVDLKLLVLAGNGQEADLAAITQALDRLGTPYTLWIAAQRPGQLTPTQLAAGCHALYQGIILTNGELGYAGPSGWVTTALTDAEWQALQSYEASFGIRRLSWYTYPSTDDGFNRPAGPFDTSTTPIPAHLTTDGQAVFSYVRPGASLSIQGVFTYLATPLTDGRTTPLLVDAQGNALAAVRSYADGRQLLALTFDGNDHVTQNQVLWYGLINWVTRGLFVGQRHAYLSPQVDDLFSGGTMRADNEACGTVTDSGGSYRTSGSDFAALLAWQHTQQASPISAQLVLSFAFIGSGTVPGVYVPDTLTPSAQTNAAQVRWISHTYTHPDLDTADYATASNEIRQNITVASNLGLAPFSTSNLVTPAYTGLTNPAVLQAAYDAGARFLATGASNPTPNAGVQLNGSFNGAAYQLLAVPRHETNLYFDVSTPQQWLHKDQCKWPAGTSNYAADYSALLQRESQTLRWYLLRGDLDPLMFHQLNMRAYDGTHSLLSDLLARTLDNYSQLVTVPVLSPNMQTIGALMTARMQYDAARAGLTASETSGASGQVLNLSSTSALSVPITGLHTADAEIYAGQPIATVTLKAAGSVAIPIASAGSGMPTSTATPRATTSPTATPTPTRTPTAAPISGGGSPRLLTQAARVVDTRQSGGPVQPGVDRCFGIAGQAGVPLNASGVTLNMTAVGYTGPGWLTLYPAGQALPATSTLAFDASEYAIANGAVVRLGTGGQVCVNTGRAASNVILDVTGYLVSAGASDIQLLPNPVRVVDTRSGGGAPIQPTADRCFTITLQTGIPSGAYGLFVNLTSVGYSSTGSLTLYAAGSPRPPLPTLNFNVGEWAIANSAVLPLATNGQVCLSAAQSAAHGIVDVVGYIPAAAAAQPHVFAQPQRLVDTRSSGGPVQPGTDRCFQAGGLAGIPSASAGVMLNVTALGHTADGWLSLYPAGQSAPATSSLNYDSTQVAISNGTLVRLSTGGQVCVKSGMSPTQVLLDVSGYLP